MYIRERKGKWVFEHLFVFRGHYSGSALGQVQGRGASESAGKRPPAAVVLRVVAASENDDLGLVTLLGDPPAI